MLENLTTETRNQSTLNLDQMPILSVLKLMQEEDATLSSAIQAKLPQIERVVAVVIESFKQGGRLIYIGAGTSGRLGILDAVECVPTFGTEPEMVQGIIAGGETAIRMAVEGAEDSPQLGREDIRQLKVNSRDTVIGVAASGRTPYVIGALQEAAELGARTASLACNEDSEIARYAEHAIEIVTGAEILTGSTRLKAGTAQKMVMNMISTVAMIGIGKVYSNLMVDVKPTNEKLVQRAKAMISEITGCDEETAASYYELSKHQVKVAVVMLLMDLGYEEAQLKLMESDGFIRRAIQDGKGR
ncbi:N-acetylmuramic acid 6-phosphate etherase [Paenibacillus donghaensis]|uniref:N-acetylmuramic acid 6-phosphate etherase n=1 Tax=Paenibacillus donghaensis TaxID=414771 RepID=A0A2Z2KMR7_9BACL|nr:N-acetylmuramic acid 6-phosphate etherase [Paenibacillus donghaensis]ASA19988.1 N-acetylmuramic acid 6-phosphate etherase [Paenibacillus donghaensis]